MISRAAETEMAYSETLRIPWATFSITAKEKIAGGDSGYYYAHEL